MTDSFYLTRLKNYYDQDQYGAVQGDVVYSHYLNHKWLGHTAEIRYSEISYTEETYKGHQLIIRKVQMDWAFVTMNSMPVMVSSDEALVLPDRGEWNTTTFYSAYAWRIRDLDVEPEVLNTLWNGDCFIVNNYVTNSHKQTMTKLKKRIDIEAILLDHKSILNELSHNRIGDRYGTVSEPYNLKVHDWVWIQAHGRLRNGIVIGTQGRRFIVGYTTPSNPNTMKYKTVSLSETRVVEGDLIDTQPHNLVQIGA